jgi:hypothetical protein
MLPKKKTIPRNICIQAINKSRSFIHDAHIANVALQVRTVIAKKVIGDLIFEITLESMSPLLLKEPSFLEIALEFNSTLTLVPSLCSTDDIIPFQKQKFKYFLVAVTLYF